MLKSKMVKAIILAAAGVVAFSSFAAKAPRFLLAYGNHDWFGYRKKPGEGANAFAVIEL